MSGRTLLVALALLSTGLAGCLGKDDAPVDQQDVVGNETLNDQPPEGRGPLVAFEETNETEEGLEGVDHHHDYWMGRERVTIFETVDMMSPFPGTSGVRATFRPPQGTFIYEGTGSVEFTLAEPKRHVCEAFLIQNGHYICTDKTQLGVDVPATDDPNPPTNLKLRYKHASTTEWIDAGPIVWNQPVPIKIVQAIETDMPHVTSSGWEFQVVSPNPEDFTLTFTAKAEIIRSTATNIPLWPGHPLFYSPEKPSRVVVDNVKAESCDGLSGVACALVSEPGPVTAEKLISYGTKTLFVWVNISDYQAPNPATAPFAWFIYHRNATGYDNITSPFDDQNYGIAKRELFWILPVDDGGMDSPYSDGSKWNFELGASWKTPDNPAANYAFYGGLADWAAKYTITVVASSVVLPASEYHMSCLDAEVYCPQPEETSPEAPHHEASPPPVPRESAPGALALGNRR